jgi:hypothetical protein
LDITVTRFWEFDPASMLGVLPSAEGRCADPANWGPAPECPICGRFIGMLQWLPPFRVELRLIDNIWDDWIQLSGDDFLVSEAYVKVHRSHDFSGLTPFAPAEVVGIRYRTSKKPAAPTYFVTKVLRSIARVDDKASDLVRDAEGPPCSICGGPSEISRERLVLESGTWRGEDWFVPQNLKKTLVTDRVVQAVGDAGLTGFRFERCERAKYRTHWPRDSHGRQLPL